MVRKLNSFGFLGESFGCGFSIVLYYVKERRCVHHSNFVMLKNLKGGLKNEKIYEEED